MPPKRPKLVDDLVQVPRLGRYVRSAHEAWLRAKFKHYSATRRAAARQAFSVNGSVLSDVQRRVVADLNNCGIAHVHFDELFGDRQLWDHISESVQQWLDSHEVKDKERAYLNESQPTSWKEYIVRLYGKEPTVSGDCIWLRLALQPQILNIVNSYLGMLSKLIAIDLWNTIARAHTDSFTGSQRWHRDPEDTKLVKVFLYFTDVDFSSGPLHYVPHSRKGERYGHLWPQRIPNGSVPPSHELEAVIPRSDWEICAYPSGTFVFVDTTGFHMGGRATQRNRVLANWIFVTPGSLWPRTFKLESDQPPQSESAAAKFSLS